VPHGTVHAGIKAREVVALGNITGNVEASEKIEIHKEAKLVGDIRTARIIIEDGAYFKGSIDIVKPEPAKAPPSRQPPPRTPPRRPPPPARQRCRSALRRSSGKPPRASMELPGPLKGMMGGPHGAPPANAPAKPGRLGPSARFFLAHGGGAANAMRPSRGLEEFFGYIHANRA